jgi:uncharacterized cupredoxin-like copper-binding protein
MNRIRIILGVVLASGFLALLVAPITSARSTSVKVTTVTVTMKEFKFILSRKTVPHGKIIFKLVNKGALVHDFMIATKKSLHIPPHKTGKLVVTLAKGLHRYKCTIDSHARFGMKGTLKVT